MTTQMKSGSPSFVASIPFAQAEPIETPRGKLLIASCQSGNDLACKVVDAYNQALLRLEINDTVPCLQPVDYQFSDSETCVRLNQHVAGHDVFLFQSLLNPISQPAIDQNYMAFLLAVRAFREHGARHVTAVLPYLAYARQDKPTKFKREPISAKLMADLSIEAGIDRLITWHPHSDQLQGFYGQMPVICLDGMNLFVETFRHLQGRDDVIIVAPDAGASKFVTYVGRMLNLKSAVAAKYRPQQEEAVITEIIGDFSDKRIAIVLDDMISSGGTIYELIKTLVTTKGIDQVYLGASHNLCMQSAYERLQELNQHYRLAEVVITNSIPQTKSFLDLDFIKVHCLSDTLCRTINRIHYHRSVSELFYH